MRRPRPRLGPGPRIAVVALALVLQAPGARPAEAQRNLPTELKTVASIRFDGRHGVPAKALRNAIKTKAPSWLPWKARPALRLDFLRSDTLTIERLYQQHGYLDARARYRLEERDSRSVEVTFVIEEGHRSMIHAVNIVAAQPLPERNLRRRLYARPGRPFNPLYLIADTTRIAAAYHERGYLPHIVARASRESLAVAVRYEVTEGPQYRYGQVYVSSPEPLPVRERIIRRELLMTPGQVYRESRVERSIERLYETGLFSQVQLTPLVDSTNTQIEFDLRLRARKSQWVDAGVGSGTSERLRFTGEWGHRNLARRGMQGVLSARLALDERARFLLAGGQASIVEPWLFRSRTRGVLSGYVEDRRDRADPRWIVSQTARGVTVELRRELGRFTRLSLSQDNIFVNQRIEILEADLSPEVRDSLTVNVVPSYTTHRLELALGRDSRDTPIDPTRGSVQLLTGEVAGGPLRGTSSFTKAHYTASWYTSSRTGWVLASRMQVGAMDPFGEEAQFSPEAGLDAHVARVPLEDRFRIGGVNSVRGYEENEIPLSGGLAAMLLNAELRVPLNGLFGVELYVDAGNVWARPAYLKADDFVPRTRSDSPNDVHLAAGAGLRVTTPVGPLRIDFSWGSHRDKDGRRPRGRPQFAIGPSF